MTKCAKCETTIVHHSEAHAVRGELFCSKSCAIRSLTDDYMRNAKELAIEEYDSEAEVVSTLDILAEDLQEVRVTQTCVRIVKVPKDMSKTEAILEVTSMVEDGTLIIDDTNCDTCTVHYELVDDDNSSDEEVQ